jgi:hypothetical protein
MLSSTLPDFSIPATARGQSSTVRSHVQTRRTMRAPQLAGSSAMRSASFFSQFTKRAMRSPMRSVIVLGISASCAAILVNALWLQKSRHPMSQRATEIITQSAVPLPPVRPTHVTQSPSGAVARDSLARDELARLAGPVAVNTGRSAGSGRDATPARETTPASVAAPTPKVDPIGDLLRAQDSGSGNTRSNETRSSDTRSGDARPVAAAQRALVKLGYPVSKTDGRFGEETRVAIERFERDRKIPVTRELSPRTLRELSAASGTRIE